MMHFFSSRARIPFRQAAPLLTLALLAAPTASHAQLVRSGAGAAPGDILATVNQFRADLGGVNNGNAVGPIAGGRREINWDGGGASAPATTFPTTMTTFNSGGTPRGGVFTTPGTGFEISGQPSPEFGDINATYPGIFGTFSSPRLFTPLGSNITDALFFIPGTNTLATVSGFGAVFTDVDLANTTSMSFFDIGNNLIGTFFVPNVAGASETLSFLGVSFPSSIVARVRIVTGNVAIGPDDSNGNPNDVVVMDDFIYAEPVAAAAPEPGTLVLGATGLMAFLGGLATRRHRRA
jgi:hypothetical protein